MTDYKSFKPLDKYLFVAVMIYHITEIKKECIWFTKLVELLSEYMSKSDVSHALDTLIDWLIIDGENGEIEKGRAAYVYYIDTHDGGDFRIKELYDKYWDRITGDKHE